MKPPASIVRGISLVVLFLLLTVTISACGGDEEEAPPESTGPGSAAGDTALPAPGEQAVLRCSEACTSRGHCGRAVNEDVYVLLDRDGPVAAAGQHDMAVLAETMVTVREIRPETLVSPSGEEQLQNFFRVLVSGREEEGWVASWCIAGLQ
jgi:hypothetical protein